MNQPPTTHKQFVFESYVFDHHAKTLRLHYSLDGTLPLKETYRFDFDFVEYDPGMLDRAVQNLFFMAGVSYYKMFVPSEIVIRRGELDPMMASFFAKTYQKGLGEFFYVNQLDPQTIIPFPVTTPHLPAMGRDSNHQGLLIGLGGGKDSLLSVELLRDHGHAATWSVNHRPQLTPLVERVGLPHYWVEREWDPYLFEHKARGGLNGHVPISALFACVGTVVAVLSGRRDVVVSNESSANEPTLNYMGTPINHQYSKSLEFEQDFQAYLQHIFSDAVRYYSFTRPLSELHIAQLFVDKTLFDKYRDVFSSCNRGFVHGSDHMIWCGTCPKCAFAFLILTPFVPREKLEALFGGENLLLDPALEKTYRQLLGIEGDKPLDCIGEVKESRAAMKLAQQVYPELLKYRFDIPLDYDYRTLSASSMPPDMLRRIVANV